MCVCAVVRVSVPSLAGYHLETNFVPEIPTCVCERERGCVCVRVCVRPSCEWVTDSKLIRAFEEFSVFRSSAPTSYTHR